jgi:chemotaxis protein MotB
MAKKVKQQIEEQEEGAPAWMATFGDLMSLLMTFFVLMLSFSAVKEDEFNKAMSSLQKALSLRKYAAKNESISKDIKEGPAHSNKPAEGDDGLEVGGLEMTMPWRDLVTEVRRELEKVQNLGGSLDIEANEKEIRMVMPNLLEFEAGGTKMKSESIEIISRLSRLLKRIPYDVNVEGHVDRSELKSSKYQSNLQLSTARAQSVAAIMLVNGVKENQLSVKGLGTARPRAVNDTFQGRARNRRVEIIISHTTREQYLQQKQPLLK